MPISPIVLQRRHAELGRIRLGDKGSKGQPQKLNRFRFTSPSQRHIEDIARLYGGTAQAWRNGNRDEWEVYTEAASIPVVVVKGGISQWLETWSGGGCTHRCDGYHNVLTDTDCDANDPAHKAAKPTTRLSVMLRELDAIGVFRLESHGWNAAAELPGLVELAMHVGELVPANLYLAERLSIKDGKTSRFVVPGLDLEVSPARLTALVSGQGGQQRQAVGSGQQRAIEQQPAGHGLSAEAIASAIAACTTPDQARDLWQELKGEGALTEQIADAITGRVEQLKATPAGQEAASEPAAGQTDELDADILWQQAVAEAGRLGWTTAQLSSALESDYDVTPASASAEQLAAFVHTLRTGEVA